MKPSEVSIHTLNARGNMFLTIVRDRFHVSPSGMLREIQHARFETEAILKSKGIEYGRLKNALIPHRKRREVALLFDRTKIETPSYGFAVFEHIIPLFDRRSTHSILCGDYIGERKHQGLLKEAMMEAATWSRQVRWQHSSQFFIVYVNHLTDAMFHTLTDSLDHFAPYVGYVDTTFGSLFKHLAAGMLVNVCIKHGNLIIQGHPDDVPLSESQNACGYSFEDSDYKLRSIPCTLYDLFLSYKIERPVIAGWEDDVTFSLNSIAEVLLPLNILSVQIDESKLTYLRQQKEGSMTRAELCGMSAAELEAIVRQKIDASYIYNMVYKAQFDTCKFNVMLELGEGESKVTRLVASLEYQPERKALRLITLF